MVLSRSSSDKSTKAKLSAEAEGRLDELASRVVAVFPHYQFSSVGAAFERYTQVRDALLVAFESGLDEVIPQRRADEVPDDLTDAKIATVEARTDTKIARLEGKIDVLTASVQQSFSTLTASVAQQRAEASSNRTAIITTVVAVGFALAALLLAVMAYGDAIFSRGMSVRDVVKAVQEEAKSMAASTPPVQPSAADPKK